MDNNIKTVLQDFVNARTWQESRQVLLNHEDIEVRPSFWTVAIRSRKTEENWEIIENGTAKKTDIQRGI